MTHEDEGHLEVDDRQVITSYVQAPARTITAGGVTYAYRELGAKAASR